MIRHEASHVLGQAEGREERDKELFSLEKGQVSGDMIELYKIRHGMQNTDREKVSSLSPDTRTQGQPMKLKGPFRTDKTISFFTQRRVKPWNSLLQDDHPLGQLYKRIP